MDGIEAAAAALEGFRPRAGDYAGAEAQLAQAAELYAKLTPEGAAALRARFDPAQRLGWLGIGCRLLARGFEEAEEDRRTRLRRMVFALYSLDSLQFGYDSLLQIDRVTAQLIAAPEAARRDWAPFAALIAEGPARANLENRLFPA